MTSYRLFRPPQNSTFPPPPSPPNQNNLQPPTPPNQNHLQPPQPPPNQNLLQPPPPPNQNHLQPPPPLPNQNHLQPPPQPSNQNYLKPLPRPPLPRGGSQYLQNWGPYSYSGNKGLYYSQNYTQKNLVSNYQLSPYGSSSSHQHPFQYQPSPPPPPPESSSYPPLPPPPPLPPQSVLPHPLYYTSSRFSYFKQPLQQLQPSLQPQPLQMPHAPPPLASPPPLPPLSYYSSPSPVPLAVMSMESKQTNAGDLFRKGQKALLPPSGKKYSGYVPSRRTETEDERRLIKKREYEKQKQEEKMKQQLRETQSKVLLKSQMLASGSKSHGELFSRSHMSGDGRSSTPLLSADRTENRL